ncbi:transcriptional activator perA domain protein [Escherichia coli RN587/1]|nr:transcriptional regulator [Escherichia coli]EFZ76911.1 transcriptional activator perA domain protein [Escherichia coli RN587/1]EHU47878.1 putative PerA protein [Escherichia coli DEC2E]EGE1564742.1 transcriptional regulator [Escherichia coli]PCD50919.1 transcriptional regulator [Escherichia coli]
MEIVGIDNSNPYRKIIIDDALIKLLHSISSDDSCYVKKKYLLRTSMKCN